MMRKKKIFAFLKDRRGSIATAASLTFGVAIGTVALSVTMARTYEVRADVQRGLDAALLSAARSDEFSNPQDMVRTYVQSYVRNTGVPAKEMNVTARFDKDKGVIIGEVKFRVDTVFPFPWLLGDHMRPRVEAQVTPPGAHRMEIALALDMSGSMSMDLAGNPGFAPAGQARIDALRSALTGMFDEIAAQKTEHGGSIYVSIVPYAGSVNIGNLYKGVGMARSVRNRVPQSGGAEPHQFFTKLGDTNQRLNKYYDLGNWERKSYCVSSGWFGCTQVAYYEAWSKGDDANATYLKRGAWATERVGGNLAKDLAPDVAKVPFATFEDIREAERTKRNNATAFDKSWVTPVQHVLPLTNNVDQMRAYADNMVAYGGTAGHIGMEWAWRAISPNWGGAWAFQPTDSTGKFNLVTSVLSLAAVTELVDALLNGVGDLLNQTVGGLLGLLGLGGGGGTTVAYVTADRLPSSYDAINTSKTIIMMTDGVFSPLVDTSALSDPALRGDNINATIVAECLKAASLQNTTGSTRTNAEAACRGSFAYFERICEEAKKSGVTIYTIAFTQSADGSLDSLRRCATDPTKIFSVNTGAQLKTAFTRIFLETKNMHVSH